MIRTIARRFKLMPKEYSLTFKENRRPDILEISVTKRPKIHPKSLLILLKSYLILIKQV